jgi:ATP-dependent DNA helicase
MEEDRENSPNHARSAAPPDEEVCHTDSIISDRRNLSTILQEKQQRLSQLQHLLKQSTAYSTIIKQRMDEENAKQAAVLAARLKKDETGMKRGPPEAHASPSGKRRKGADGEPVAILEDSDEQLVFQQPALITGATLKPYQLEGLQWMVSLDQNGISGILGMCNSITTNLTDIIAV